MTLQNYCICTLSNFICPDTSWLCTYNCLVSMACAEWCPWTNTVNELNSNKAKYFNMLKLQWHIWSWYISWAWNVNFISWIVYSDWTIHYAIYNNMIGSYDCPPSDPPVITNFGVAYVHWA